MRFPFPLIRPVALAAACTGLVPAVAQTALKEVVVSGSRSEQDPDTLAQSIDVLNARQIEQRQIRDIRDVARELPNVSVQRAPARFTIGAQTGRDGNAGFNIRGLDGNRVLMLVDGVRQPRSYLFQSESAIGRDYVDVALVKRIELVRGPTSALYGSDGIAGMVNFNIAKPPLAATSVVGAHADTDMRRNRLAWDGSWQLDAPWAERLQAMLAWQDGRSNEYQFQDRNTAADRSRNTFYRERTLQGNLQAAATLRSGAAVQRLTYGMDVAQVRVENLQTGTTPPAGESFPLKRFPDTKESAAALYLQDEIVIGRWAITPGVRHDRFKIDASAAGYTAPVPPVSISDSATSPKLGVVFQATDTFAVYGQYAAGFKAPTAGQVNGFFENPIGNYRSVSNPDLKPEKSQNVELGLRGRFDGLRWDLAVFTSRFKDFIEDNRRVAGTGAPGDPLVFQSVNVGRVKLDGVELKGEAALGRVGPGTLAVPFAYGRTRGRDRDTGRPINSVNPERINLGLVYAWGPLTTRLDTTYRAAKKDADIDRSTTAMQFATPSATTLDLSAQWRIRPDLRLTAGVYNLTDRKYWNWSDVNGVSSTQATLDAWTQPGRYAKLTLVADF